MSGRRLLEGVGPRRPVRWEICSNHFVVPSTRNPDEVVRDKTRCCFSDSVRMVLSFNYVLLPSHGFCFYLTARYLRSDGYDSMAFFLKFEFLRVTMQDKR